MELAKTPLLLTLICILFQIQGEVPTKRSTLYDRTVSTLLSEWDASKEIFRQQSYKKLDPKCKEVMLSEIAYSNFMKDNLFFQQGEISNQIEKILLKKLKDENQINGRDILRDIEAQHGILVNRYEDIYSFSHLTLQEFFTAKHILDNNIDLTDLVEQHLCDRRWHQVFLLLAGLRNADDLLQTMDKQIRTYMATPNLQNLLVWVDKVTDPTPGDIQIQPLGKRAIAIAHANSNAIIHRLSYANTKAMANGNANAIADMYTNSNSNIKYNNIAYILRMVKLYGNVTSIDNLIQYVKWSVYFRIYRGLDLEGTIDNLETLKSRIPDESQSTEHRAFSQQVIRTWLTAFHLNEDMINLSKQEIQALDNYLYAHLLLIECERAAVMRTPEVWSQIESRMLRLA
jgi:hypothetical protein